MKHIYESVTKTLVPLVYSYRSTWDQTKDHKRFTETRSTLACTEASSRTNSHRHTKRAKIHKNQTFFCSLSHYSTVDT